MAADIAKAKRNVKRMVDAGAPEADIDAYLSDEGLTPDALRAPVKTGSTSYLGSLGDAFTEGLKDIPRTLKAQQDRNIAESQRPLKEQLATAPDRLLLEPFRDMAQMGGALMSPVTRTIEAAVKPVGDMVGGAAYDIGLPAYSPDRRGIGDVLRGDLSKAPQKLSREDSQHALTSMLAESVGLAAPRGSLRSLAAAAEASGTGMGRLAGRVRAKPETVPEAPATAAAVVPDPVVPPEDIFPGDLPSKLPVTETPTPPQTRKVRRYNGLDHPVEVTGPVVKDAQTGKDYVPVMSSETGAVGHVPADEVFDVPVTPEAPSAPPPEAPRAGLPPRPERPPFVAGRALRQTAVERAALQARQLAMRDLQGASRGGVDITAPAPEVPMMAAEQLGQGARNRLGAAANLSEPVATSLTNKLTNRINATTDYAARGFERDLGISPEEAARGVDETIGQMQKEAKPLYEDRVRGNETPQQSPILERMAAENPYFQQAQTAALKQLRGQDRPAYMESTQVNIPESRATGGGRSSSQYMGDVLEVIRGGARRANRGDGENLNEFIAARGGLQDVGGDLQAMNANDNTYNRGLGKLGKMIRPTGSSLHDAAVAAWEGGFFREVPTERELLDAIDQGIRGRPVRSMHSAQEGAARAEYLRQLEERIGTLDIQGGATPRQIAEALASDDASTDALTALGETDGIYPGTIGETETVQAPRLELLDMVKRNLDAMEKKAIESPSGNSLDTIPIEATRSSLLAELDKLNPDYANIRKIGGEAPRVKAIYAEAKRFVFDPSRTNAEFDKWLGDKTAPEARAALARIADDLTAVVGGRTSGTIPGNVSLAKYVTPNFRYRLTKLAAKANPGGAAQAGRFADYIEALNTSRASAMDLLPRGNSKTSRLGTGADSLNNDMGEIDLTKIPTRKTDLLNIAARPLVEAASKMVNNVKVGGLRNIGGGVSKDDVLLEYERLMSMPLPEMLQEVRSASPAMARRVDKLIEAYGGKVKHKGAKP